MRKKLIDSLYEHGHSVILLDEQKKGKDGQTLSSLDMALDGVTMDIRSITKDKQHYGSAINDKNKQLYKYNSRTDTHQKAETICLYFDDPSMFEPGKIKKGYEYMKAKTSKPQIHRIVCVVNSAKGLEIIKFDFKKKRKATPDLKGSPTSPSLDTANITPIFLPPIKMRLFY